MAPPLKAPVRASRRPVRYAGVSRRKSGGATYTPKLLADFVADQIVRTIGAPRDDHPLRILDPAIGDGELLVSLLENLRNRSITDLEVHGFETDAEALQLARLRICRRFPALPTDLRHGDFLEFALSCLGIDDQSDLFHDARRERYDIIIANPPYVRTQIMGARQTQTLARQFGLSGRSDLYYAFVLAILRALKSNGTAGLIVSNRFMTIRSGAVVRQALVERLSIRSAWDLGDTKLFDAAVLPAVLILEGKDRRRKSPPTFSAIYETETPASRRAPDPISALDHDGVVGTDDGRRFHVRHGTLDTNGAVDGVWRLANGAADAWLSRVADHSWSTFRGIGKIRVGVKTCADSVFIRDDWDAVTKSGLPELLRPLMTHHAARRFKPRIAPRHPLILYPHENVRGRRKAVALTNYPRSRAYLQRHRSTLESRHYVTAAGRKWYEIWVPQNPDLWRRPKLIFRDIAERPTFWLDLDGSVVNGDCYWLTCDAPEHSDLLWLAAAVGNSTFIERFYDYRFNNKLYSGRRRFMTQYVERFPIPDPHRDVGKQIIAKTRVLYNAIPSADDGSLMEELNALVWEAFGLVEERSG